MRAMMLALLGVATLAAPAARACDAEEMNRHLQAVCDGALGESAELATRLLPRAGADSPALAAALARARLLCAEGDPVAGAAEAARLARLVGRIEARLGDAPPIWAQRQAGLAR
jgi:hypothetical protein